MEGREGVWVVYQNQEQGGGVEGNVCEGGRGYYVLDYFRGQRGNYLGEKFSLGRKLYSGMGI